MEPPVSVALPTELRPFKPLVDSYVQAKVKQFAGYFARRLNLALSKEHLDQLVLETLGGIAHQEQQLSNSRALRLVLRHDCQSTGCGESGCLLCQYNPSRLCKRNLKNKYLIDDHLKAKCTAPLRVELVDETGACVSEGLPPGMQLEIHVLNGEKYKEICPDNTLLSHQQLRTCIISHHTKALLRREGGSDDQLRCFLQLERGQAPLSDLQVTTSSEALLAGKAPTFRLLVWAVEANGEAVPNVTYVVSESFVVATKRVKHAIKSDIPCVADHVSKLVHIGKATVDKLNDLRAAAAEEGFEIPVPDELNRIEKVGQFQHLVELSEMNSDLKNKVRHLLKLSPEKWEEVSQHAQAAVVPDFRARVWWCPAIRSGLLFACKNGAVVMDHPIALVKMGNNKGEQDSVIPIHQLDPVLFNTIPKLKQQAVQSWYAAAHPGWAIYWKEGQQDPALTAILQQANGGQLPMPIPLPGGPQLPPAPALATGGALDMGGPPVRLPTPPPLNQPTGRTPSATSPFLAHVQGLEGGPPAQSGGSVFSAASGGGQFGGGSGGSIKPNAKSPFAAPTFMDNISAAFPSWQQQQQQQGAAQGVQPVDENGNQQQGDNSMGSNPLILTSMGPNASNILGSLALDPLKSDMLPGMERGHSAWGLGPSLDPNRSTDWQLQALMGNVSGMNSGANAPPPHAAAGELPAAGANAGAAPGAPAERQLSLKFASSMSLDLNSLDKLEMPL
mmetsp:Transcript_29342/g.64952  ORF Transcript_29342/g.64952 Transcript_29342/m.64952 type:complete len:729 (+) Transcript_29342:226-2412(+)